jgi:hypothetical protein
MFTSGELTIHMLLEKDAFPNTNMLTFFRTMRTTAFLTQVVGETSVTNCYRLKVSQSVTSKTLGKISRTAFFEGWYWDLNAGPCVCLAGTLPFFVLVCFSDRVCCLT